MDENPYQSPPPFASDKEESPFKGPLKLTSMAAMCVLPATLFVIIHFAQYLDMPNHEQARKVFSFGLIIACWQTFMMCASYWLWNGANEV